MASRSGDPNASSKSKAFAWEPITSHHENLCPELHWRRPRTGSAKRWHLLLSELESPQTDLCLTPINLRYIPQLAKSGLLHPLKDFLTKEESKNYFRPALDLCSYESVLFAIPEDFSPYVMASRRDALKRLSLSPAKTWKELEKQSSKLIRETQTPPIGISSGTGGHARTFFLALFASNGIHPSSIAANILEHERELIETYQWFQQACLKHQLIDLNCFKSGYYNPADFFNRKKWIYRFCSLAELHKQPSRVWKGIDIHPFPFGPSGKTPTSLVHGQAWIIPHNSTHPELGIRALRRITSKDVALKQERERAYPFHAQTHVWRDAQIRKKQPFYRAAKSLFAPDRLYSPYLPTQNLNLLCVDLIHCVERNLPADQWLAKIPRKIAHDVHGIVKRAVSYIRSHSTESLTINDIARALSKSRRHLHRLFKQEMHVSPTDYLKSVKMENARELLKNKSLSIKEVAAQSGFSDVNVFSRAFRKHWGSSPSTARSSKNS
jgi:AraC-like DNA-binding protein